MLNTREQQLISGNAKMTNKMKVKSTTIALNVEVNQINTIGIQWTNACVYVDFGHV